MITKDEFQKEQRKLKTISKEVKLVRDNLAKEVVGDLEEFREFQKLAWQDKSSFDRAEFNQVLSNNEMEARRILAKRMYFKRICLIASKPYFASFKYQDEDGKNYNIYMSLTYLKDDNYNNILYDWRSPICSVFYDYETGPCKYLAPEGIISGILYSKRQYQIKDNKLLAVFDNSLNIDDEVLQEVLANNSSDKMKNVVNTIQKEQNLVIRNLEDKNLIVQGIAGSGKTSVALHRIAFLLYRIDNLSSKDILIFSPNEVFSSYISNVLPELGEENTKETTFSDYLSYFIKEYKSVEPFTNFIAKFYEGSNKRKDLITYKQSREIVIDLDNYINDYILDAKVIKDLELDKVNTVSKEEINYLLHDKYSRFPFFERIREIAKKLSLNYYGSEGKKRATIEKKIIDNANFKKDYKSLYVNFYKSKYSKYQLLEEEEKEILKTKELSYEDALLFAYLKGTLEGFPYEGDIKQVVVDEAQDYNYLQYQMMKKIFKKASFTILGDINQNMNPYINYKSLEELKDIFDSSIYLELLKTYRLSKEIIEYTNKILGLSHVCAIRKDNSIPVTKHQKDDLLDLIPKLRSKYKSLAIITKDRLMAENLYKKLESIYDLSLLTIDSKNFRKDFVIAPSYLAKGLEFDSVIVYNSLDNPFKEVDKYLYYIACTRCQHELHLYYLQEKLWIRYI